jgi:hypothetical protein
MGTPADPQAPLKTEGTSDGVSGAGAADGALAGSVALGRAGTALAVGFVALAVLKLLAAAPGDVSTKR